jgi:hypothetical protein
VDCADAGYTTGESHQVGNADEWNECCVFTVDGTVAGVWVNWDGCGSSPVERFTVKSLT